MAEQNPNILTRLISQQAFICMPEILLTQDEDIYIMMLG